MAPRSNKVIAAIRKPLIRADEIFHTFSATGRAIFYVLAALILVSSIGIIFLFNQALMVTVPARGGSLSEGIVGSPRFINPVLAISDADHDLTALVYSGLLRANPDGNFIPDLAESYDISQDGRTYTVHLRPKLKFQDGTPVTADDVIFTVQKVQDPALKSPLRANWQGVAVTEVDPFTVQFTLSQPYAPFIENLTLGILPKHLWNNVNADEFPFSDLNSKPVGSGPYQVTGVAHTPSGVPSAYTLRAFSGYALGEPYLTNFTFKFYQNEEALMTGLSSGDVDAASGVSPASIKQLGNRDTILSIPLNRVFGVFFNQNNNPALQDATARKALSDAIDRNDFIQTVLGGYATPIESATPPDIDRTNVAAASTTPEAALAAAKQELADAGWKPDQSGVLAKSTGSGKNASSVELSFTISTGNVPELRSAAEYLRKQWTALGAKVQVQVYDQGDLSENVIRPRKYDALLFGEVVGRGLDLFAFWHSSQRNDPGLNIALYANASVDATLEKLRQASDESTRQNLYKQFDAQIAKDTPAVFLYTPDFIYAVPKDLQGINLGFIENPSDRFDNVAQWHRATDHVWSFFAR